MKIMTKHLSTLLLLFATACSSEPFKPTCSPNPWSDDYNNVAGMGNWEQWGTYNIHDPSCLKVGDYYYMYTTDAIYQENIQLAKDLGVPIGNIQVRRSKDLINWDFIDWAFDDIPTEAVEWVHSNNDGIGATNIWAPYIIAHKNIFRLYYSVSAFGRKTSYIGMAESTSPEGPWANKGAVVKSNNLTPMNAIDPSVIVDAESGKWWMHYGSYFGGLYCVELNPSTGMTMNNGDYGHLVARRANYKVDNLEAPEIIYHPDLDEYFLFTSYDPLMTTYNVRVCRSKSAYDNFVDITGKQVRDTTNNLPILTAPYQFKNHPGWAGTAHCSVFSDNEGRYFMAHQGRLAPDNMRMVLHLREIFFTEDGWPVVSPQRYNGTKQQKFHQRDLAGEWEIIRVYEPRFERQLEAGQILWGEGELKNNEWNKSTTITLKRDNSFNGAITQYDNSIEILDGAWQFNSKKQLLSLSIGKTKIDDLIIFAGHDWENETETILFTGLDEEGRSIWGKRVK